jgi:hypothetical protein
MVTTLRAALPGIRVRFRLGHLRFYSPAKVPYRLWHPPSVLFSWYQGLPPAGILESEITSRNLPYLLIIASLLLLLLMHIIIILGMHSVIIIFLIKASSRNAIRKTIWEVSEAANTLLVYLSRFLPAVAVFRKPNAIPLFFSIGLVLNRAPPQVAGRGTLTRYGGYRRNKIPGWTKTSTAARQFGIDLSRARGRKNLDQKSPDPPGWGLMQRASSSFITKKQELLKN